MTCSCIYRGEGEVVTCEGCGLRARVAALETENIALRVSAIEVVRLARSLERAVDFDRNLRHQRNDRLHADTMAILDRAEKRFQVLRG